MLKRLTLVISTVAAAYLFESAAGEPLTVGEVQQMSTAQLASRLGEDLFADIIAAKLENVKSPGMNLNPASPAWVGYYTRPKNTGWPGFCQAKHISILYDDHNISQILVTELYGVSGRIGDRPLSLPARQDLDKTKAADCGSVTSVGFTAADLRTALAAFRSIQKIADDFGAGVEPDYEIECDFWSVKRSCNKEDAKVLASLRPSAIQDAQFQDCDSHQITSWPLYHRTRICLNIGIGARVSVEMGVDKNGDPKEISSVHIRLGGMPPMP
jgi:hypothetical protein